MAIGIDVDGRVVGESSCLLISLGSDGEKVLAMFGFELWRFGSLNDGVLGNSCACWSDSSLDVCCGSWRSCCCCCCSS